jgi:hypothetical protein
MAGILRAHARTAPCLHWRPECKLALALQEADPTSLNHRLVRVTETTALCYFR